MTTPLPLKQHQREGISWIQEVQRGLLADEPGLGKTRVAIEAFDGGKNLVIAPKMVIVGGTWRDELRKWSSDPDNPDLWRVVPYSQLFRRKSTGRGSGSTPIKVLKDEVKGSWDALVLDEAHYVKTRDTYQTWAVKEIRAGSVLPMTGTPFPNWAHEVFVLLQLIYPEEAKPTKKYGSFWRWAEQWFDTRPTRWSNGQPSVGEILGCIRTKKECAARPATDPCQHWLDFGEDNFGAHYLRHWREDCLDLPPITIQDVETPMAPATKKAYLELKAEFFTQYEENEIVAWNQGAKNVQLHKLTTSPWLLTHTGKAGGGKLDQLKYDLEQRTRPTLVFAHYRDSVNACAEVATQIGATVGVVHGGIPDSEAARAIESFKSGELDVLCGSLEALAEGLTLTVADCVIMVEESFKTYRNTQAINRVWRLGQERPVSVRRYLTPNSVDTKKRRLLDTKNDHQMRALTAAEFAEIV